MTQSLEWFKDRVGKRIFRDHHECCTDCTEVAENGLIISDEQQAEYLFDIQNEFGAEGFELNYRSKKNEN